jgi:hypothetical protein
MVTSYAQKNSVLVYGSVNLDAGKTTNSGIEQNYKSFYFSPGIGYQISDHSTVGMQGLVYGGSSGFETRWTAGVFYRYTEYLTPIFFVYLQGNASYDDQGTSAKQTKGFLINAVPALGAMVYKGWAINLNMGGIGYRNTKTNDGLEKTQGVFLNFGSGATIGFSKNFGGHKKVVAKE